MNKCGILVVSFGTSYPEVEKTCILSVEQYIAHQFRGVTIYRAYTSNIVRGIIKKRGVSVDSVEEALERMLGEGIEEVFVQPTLLINGYEYEKIIRTVDSYKERFQIIQVGAPLLGGTEDMIKVANIVQAEYKMKADEGLVLMGHGTEHFCNTTYAAMEYICQEQGYQNMYVGTVEAYPDVDIVIRKVREANIKKITLIPFMLVAGDHAINDMAGDHDSSWKNRFQKEGIEVRAVMKGLGEYKGICEVYVEHINL